MDEKLPHPLRKQLSERECEILVMLADGLSDSEIAQSLVLQVSTVKWYNRQIFNKLKVNNRREAALLVKEARDDHERGASLPYNLPAPVTPFIGRTVETAAVCQLVNKARLVTILAPGGMGKTRLALAAAERLKDSYKEGACYVPLAAVAPGEPLASSIAHYLNLSIQREMDIQAQLLTFLRRKSLLLVLDNFEHLLDQASLVSQMLEAAPQLRILITSRERLHLHGEAIYSLGGLSYPQNYHPGDSTAYDALALLTQCAQLNIADFQLDATSGTDAVRLCQFTGGMPLAIELAVAWIESLSLAEIVEAITRSRDLLASTMRDLPERHANISAVLVTAWERLTPTERSVFMHLTVFRGGCSRGAARAVTNATPETLAALVDKGLVRLNGAGRYSFHELLRQYGEEQLAACGETERIKTIHSRYYLQFLAAHEPGLKGGRQQATALDEIEADFENIRSAWYWAVEQRDAQQIDAALESLYWFCEFRNRVQQRNDLLQAAVQTFQNSGTQDLCLYGRLIARSWSDKGIVALPTPTSISARRLLKQAHELAKSCNDNRELAICCYQRGLAAASADHDRAASALFSLAYAGFIAMDDRFYAAQALLWWAFSEVDLMRFADAEAHARSAVTLLRELGEEVGLARALLTLGATVENKPDYVEAEHCYEDAYRLLHHVGAHVDAANVGGWYLAGAALRTGNFDRHRMLAEELLAVAEEQGLPALKARACGSLSLASFISGDYESARRWAQESITLFDDYAGGIIAPVFLAYALVMLGEEAHARAILKPVLQGMLTTRFIVFDYVTLPVIAILLAADGFPEHAAVAMGLSLNHSASMYAWAKLVFDRTQLQSRLEEQLGEDIFRHALTQAGSLNAVDVFRWFIDVEVMTDQTQQFASILPKRISTSQADKIGKTPASNSQ